MYSGRKRIFFAAWAAVCLSARCAVADSEGDPTCQAPGAKRYDGVGIKVIPCPSDARPRRKPMAVFTTRRESDAEFFRDSDPYDTYVSLSNRPFTPARVARLYETVLNQGLREAKRQARRMVKKAYLGSFQIDADTYIETSRAISQLSWGGSKAKSWRFQYDSVDPDMFDRYDSDWDDFRLLEWGPLTLTDRGSLDIDTSLTGLSKFWSTSLDDVQIAPDPPGEPPRRLLVGRTVRFTRNARIRVSTSKLLKTFYQDPADEWGENLLRAGRYAQVTVGLDFYTDILKRKYLGTDLECRLYPTGRWAVFANVQLLGR